VIFLVRWLRWPALIPDSEILIKTFSAVKSRNSTSSSSDTCSFEQLSIIDIDIDIDIDTPWQLPPKAIQEGRRTLLKLIHDRRPGNHMNPDSRYNLDLISMILSDCNIDPNFGTSDRGMYPLHLAAKYKDAKLAKLLIQHGAKVSIHDNQGRTPLHVAAELSVNDSISLAVVKAILSTTDMGNCVERFLDRANAVDSAGHTILWKASASISSPRKQPTAAATATATAMFQYLLTLPAEVINFRSPSDKEYPTALWAAFSPRGCVETARALLFQANADPLVRAERDNNCTLLHKVEWPTVGILYDELISKCAVWAKLKPVTEYSPDPDKHSPDLVPDSESKTTCREVNYCTTPNNLGFQPIHLAASSGLLPLCHSLLSRGIDINTPDAQGATPLSLASEAGHFSLVYDFVVNRGADVTVRDEFGHDAFVAACSGGHVPVACFLLGRQFRVPPHHQLHDSHDADSHHLHDNDTDSQDSECEGKGNGNGTTKRKGKWASRDINEVDATGLSPVYIAAIMGHVDVVKFLVDLGANTDGIEDDKIASIMEGTCEKKKGERQLRVDAIRKLLGLSPLKVGVDVGNQKELVPPRGSLRLRRNKTR